jgi:hypothetical protein
VQHLPATQPAQQSLGLTQLAPLGAHAHWFVPLHTPLQQESPPALQVALLMLQARH